MNRFASARTDSMSEAIDFRLEPPPMPTPHLRRLLLELAEVAADCERGFQRAELQLTDALALEAVRDRATWYGIVHRRLGVLAERYAPQTAGQGAATVTGVFRGWTNLERSSDRSVKAVLEECERAGGFVRTQYAAVLAHPLPRALRTILQAQSEVIVISHRRIHSCRLRLLSCPPQATQSTTPQETGAGRR